MRALVIGEVNAAGIKPTAASLVTAAVKAAGVTDMLLLGQGQSAPLQSGCCFGQRTWI